MSGLFPSPSSHRTIVFWQHILSHHQAEMMRSLAGMGWDVRWHVTHRMSPRRAKVGWSVPDVTGIKVLEIAGLKVVDAIQNAGPDALHIFSPRGTPAGRHLLLAAFLGRIRHAFFCEKPNGTGLRLRLASLYYRLAALLLPRCEFMLALGESGASFYRKLGFRKVFPFWYTVPSSCFSLGHPPAGDTYTIIVVSRLVRLKRVDVILRALAHLGDTRWLTEVYGDGPERPMLETLVAELGLADCVRFMGVVPTTHVRRAMSEADTLVLASEWEGWGAVGNEALAEGCRMAISDACGSGCLAGLSPRAEIFRANDHCALSAALSRHIALGRVTVAERQSRAEMHSRIDGSAAAVYISDILKGKSPRCPWDPV